MMYKERIIYANPLIANLVLHPSLFGVYLPNSRCLSFHLHSLIKCLSLDLVCYSNQIKVNHVLMINVGNFFSSLRRIISNKLKFEVLFALYLKYTQT
jgi:hypothetical protein